MQFAEQFPDLQIVTPLVTQLSWSHFVVLSLPAHNGLAMSSWGFLALTFQSSTYLILFTIFHLNT